MVQNRWRSQSQSGGRGPPVGSEDGSLFGDRDLCGRPSQLVRPMKEGLKSSLRFVIYAP
ncbi:unnamed protein product [Symbiodinium sp. CCMP2592]|nr:unnamed protein product [Symbiodinium sp. CCMP2592]